MSDAEDFGKTAADLLPPGTFWEGFRDPAGRGRQLLNAKGDTIAARRAADKDLLRETYPPSTTKMIGDWEDVCGLPDACTFGDLTLQERRIQVAARLTARGGQSITYFQALATALGYPVKIRRCRPFICGSRKSRCGRDQISYLRNAWVVTVTEKRITRFRCGASRCGEALVTVRRAYDLECELRRRGPAHADLTVLYQD